MINNGKVDVKRATSNGTILDTFTYQHSKAIEGYKPVDFYCQVNIDIPNTYLQSILDLFDSNFYRFTDGKVHSNEDKFILEETNGIIITYTYRKNNKYTGKILIKDGESIGVGRLEPDSEITEVTKGEK